MRMKILMIPSWYPTRENPISGSFFKEQAEVISEKFDICVAHVHISNCGILRYLYGYLTRGLRCNITIEESIGSIPEMTISGCILWLNPLLRRIVSNFGFDEMTFSERQRNRIYCELFDYLAVSGSKPDLIYSMTAQINCIDTCNLAKARGVPIVIAEHVPFPLPGTVINSRQRIALETCDALLTTSNHLSRLILMQNIRCFPIIVGNLVDEDIFLRSAIKRREKVFTIIIVGANNFYKDYDTFFNTVSHLRNMVTIQLRLLIIGVELSSNRNQWDEGKGEIEKKVIDNNLSEIVRLIPRVNRNELCKYYNESDAFVSTSIQETFGLSCIEAMACGLPVFATKSGGVEDFVDHSCGRLVPVRDYIGLATALKEYIDGNITFDSDHIRNTVVARYGRTAFSSRLSRIFTDCIDDFSNSKSAFHAS